MQTKILLVDDSKTVRRVIMKALSLAQIPLASLIEAENGQEALAQVNRHEVSLIFADINMPIMNGVGMIKSLKADPLRAQIPVVVVSTEGSTTRAEELEKLGVFARLRKPFQPEQLRDIVKDVLGV